MDIDIVFKKVTKSYGGVKAVENVSFKIKQGEFVFFLGPSGSGKTTLFKIMTREIIPDEGVVKVGDLVVFEPKKKIKGKDIISLRRIIGVVFQECLIIDEYTVEENVVLMLDILGISGRKKIEILNSVLDQVGLLERRTSFPRQLSGGELQRLCLARALAIEPKILLADEPTGNLDPESSWQLVEILENINKKSNTTVIMATHNFDIVNSLSKRVIKLEKGRIVADQKKGKYT